MITNDDLFCTFIKLNNNTYECMKCSNRLVVQDDIQEPPIIPCLSPFIGEFQADTIRNNVSKYTEDKELCSDQEIEQRHSLCISCEFFKNNICSKCGCLLNREKIYMNKLALKKQSCPINKW